MFVCVYVMGVCMYVCVVFFSCFFELFFVCLLLMISENWCHAAAFQHTSERFCWYLDGLCCDQWTRPPKLFQWLLLANAAATCNCCCSTRQNRLASNRCIIEFVGRVRIVSSFLMCVTPVLFSTACRSSPLLSFWFVFSSFFLYVGFKCFFL